MMQLLKSYNPFINKTKNNPHPKARPIHLFVLKQIAIHVLEFRSRTRSKTAGRSISSPPPSSPRRSQSHEPRTWTSQPQQQQRERASQRPEHTIEKTPSLISRLSKADPNPNRPNRTSYGCIVRMGLWPTDRPPSLAPRLQGRYVGTAGHDHREYGHSRHSPTTTTPLRSRDDGPLNLEEVPSRQ